MSNINNIITISELSRLVGISRPTMYKYLLMYENKDKINIPNSIIEILDYLESDRVKSKQDVYNYFSNNFPSTSTMAVLDKTKVLINENSNFLKLLEYLVDNSNKIDFEELIKIFKEKVVKNGK